MLGDHTRLTDEEIGHDRGTWGDIPPNPLLDARNAYMEQVQLQKDLDEIQKRVDEEQAKMDLKTRTHEEDAKEKIKRLEREMKELGEKGTFPLLPVIGLAVVGIGAIFVFSKMR